MRKLRQNPGANFASRELIHVPGKQDLDPRVTCTDICGSLLIGRVADASLWLCTVSTMKHAEILKSTDVNL